MKTSGVIEVECESESNSGEQVGKNGVDNVSVKFLGCKVFGSIPRSNGPNEGEVQVNPLKGELGYINQSTKEVGILLTPKIKKAPFATFSCGGLLTTVVGEGNSKEGGDHQPEKKGGNDGIISPIEPVNHHPTKQLHAGLHESTTKRTKTFRATSKASQTISFPKLPPTLRQPTGDSRSCGVPQVRKSPMKTPQKKKVRSKRRATL